MGTPSFLENYIIHVGFKNKKMIKKLFKEINNNFCKQCQLYMFIFYYFQQVCLKDSNNNLLFIIQMNKIKINLKYENKLSRFEICQDQPISKQVLQGFFINATGAVKYDQANGIPLK